MQNTETDIITKRCSMCKIDKILTEYNKAGSGRLRGECKSCSSIKKKAKRTEDRKDPKFIESHNEKARILYHKDKSFQQASSAKWYENNKIVINEKHKEYRENNVKKESIRHAIYFQENKEKIFEYRKNFYDNNPGHKLMLKNRARLNKHYKSGYECYELISCNQDFLKRWFEYHFSIDTDLSFSNYGSLWHIDHVLPCAIFDKDDEKHIRQCFHWSNLMPLLAVSNLKKGAKICYISINEQNKRIQEFCILENIPIIQIIIPSELRDCTIAGTSLEHSTTTLEEETSQDTRGNDLGHSKNVDDLTIRIEGLIL